MFPNICRITSLAINIHTRTSLFRKALYEKPCRPIERLALISLCFGSIPKYAGQSETCADLRALLFAFCLTYHFCLTGGGGLGAIPCTKLFLLTRKRILLWRIRVIYCKQNRVCSYLEPYFSPYGNISIWPE